MNIRDNSFMISCAARTGSTYLVHLIRSHPELFFHGEVFGGDRVGGLLGTYGAKMRELPVITDKLTEIRKRNPELFLYKYVLDTQGYKGVGFKYKTDESMTEKYQHITDIIRQDTDIKMVVLIRRSILAQYISHQVVLNQTGVTLALSENVVPKIKQFKVDPSQCIAYIKDVKNRQKRAENIYKAHRSIRVAYEDIVEGSPVRDQVLSELQGFLGVKTAPLVSPTKKIIKEPLSNLVSNYSKVCEELIRNGYEKYI